MYNIRYTWIRISHAHALLTTNWYGTVYGIGTCTRYAIHVLYTVGKLYTVFIRRESDAALDATAAVQGKQSAAITSIHDRTHKYHSPK